jgi:hypothetical protein
MVKTDYDNEVVGERVDFSEKSGSELCHKCKREMSSVKSGSGVVEEVIVTGRNIVLSNVEKGAGICPEHGVSYNVPSVQTDIRETCECGKEDCPTCK